MEAVVAVALVWWTQRSRTRERIAFPLQEREKEGHKESLGGENSKVSAVERQTRAPAAMYTTQHNIHDPQAMTGSEQRTRPSPISFTQ